VLPVASASAQSASLVSSEHIIATLYAYPGLSVWNQVTGNAPTVSASIVDMCAADGTGSGCDGQPWDEQPSAAWATQITALQNAGITPLVYIATDYGDQGGSTDFSLATVEKEVSAAVGWYGKGIGFMFDEAATSCSLESSYYAPLYKYVKSVTDGGTVELNPGTVSSSMSCYLSASDILQVFEGPETGTGGFQGASFPSWMAGYAPGRFAATISAGTSAGVSTDVADAARDGIGNVYVDDEAEPPNYSTLPAFWSAETADVKAEP
jgi:Spherulation-specific family 4